MNDRYKELKDDIKKAVALIEDYMEGCFSEDDKDILTATKAMKYSLFAGGKRLRGYLVLAFCRAFGGRDEAALPFAAAIEMIHAYSLIHDDLPCMDDDNMRRGKPTNHKVFGEAVAVLAGDGLLTKAFGVAASNAHVSSNSALEAVVLLSEAASEKGMIGGQIMDMYGEEHRLSLEELKKLHRLKTGALIAVSAKLGAVAAGVSLADERAVCAAGYAEELGLAFQIRDDILDVIGDEATLGKPIGSDAENSKNTFLTHMSLEDAKKYTSELTENAKRHLADIKETKLLLDLADMMLERNV